MQKNMTIFEDSATCTFITPLVYILFIASVVLFQITYIRDPLYFTSWSMPYWLTLILLLDFTKTLLCTCCLPLRLMHFISCFEVSYPTQAYKRPVYYSSPILQCVLCIVRAFSCYIYMLASPRMCAGFPASSTNSSPIAWLSRTQCRVYMTFSTNHN